MFISYKTPFLKIGQYMIQIAEISHIEWYEMAVTPAVWRLEVHKKTGNEIMIDYASEEEVMDVFIQIEEELIGEIPDEETSDK